MFCYENIQKLNELELLVYHYVMQNKKQITYMTVRELADAVHVSSSTVMRFCKKLGCDGYSEFRVKFKMYLKEEKKEQPKEDLDEILHYFQGFHTSAFEEQIAIAANMIKESERVIFIGIGTSGILGKYGARYFSNLHKFCQYIEDPYYPILEDICENAVVIALSESGETRELLQMVSSFKEHNCKILSVTNKNSCTLAKMADFNMSYFVSEQKTESRYNITTQVPVLFLIEAIGRRL